MRYTLFIYADESGFADFTEEQMQESVQAYGAYIGALKKAGVFVDTDRLQPSSSATTLSLKNGTRVVQDGPFADTKEQLGGYFVIDVADLDAAMDWSQKCPAARYGHIEIRPSGMPPQNK